MIDGGWACNVCEVARKGFLCFVLSGHTSYCSICASLLAVHLKIPLTQNDQMTYTDTGKLKQLEKDLSHYFFVHFRSDMDWSGCEHGLLF